MTNEQAATLSEVLEKQYKYYHGWHFNYEYPGFFVYSQMGGGSQVLFTPDHGRDGELDIQVMDSEGNFVEGEGVPYSSLNAFEIFALVKPYLDKHSG